jgi:hypothetical protein
MKMTAIVREKERMISWRKWVRRREASCFAVGTNCDYVDKQIDAIHSMTRFRGSPSFTFRVRLWQVVYLLRSTGCTVLHWSIKKCVGLH